MTQDEARALSGRLVRLRLKAAYGGDEVSGAAADGLVLVISPSDGSESRFTFNYQQVGEILDAV
ncbi:MAG TPA: hypothetical protein VMU49_04330 [Candidatus Acidoferrales bacterium]|nr:hypothetical protein [Candidatus Acidoferrales bacterium]